jgi:hypothetical protein
MARAGSCGAIGKVLLRGRLVATQAARIRAAATSSPRLPRRWPRGALRSQDLRTGGDPASLDGAILRVDPNTGAALPHNRSRRARSGRAPHHRLRRRNPFRFTHRPGMSEVWPGDVGSNDWEELNRVVAPTDAVVKNFTCHAARAPPASRATTAQTRTSAKTSTRRPALSRAVPRVRYSDRLVANEVCPTGSSSVAGWRSSSTAAVRIHPSTTVPTSSPITRATASGSCRAAAASSPARRTSRRSRAALRTPSSSRSAPAATSSTPTSTAGRFAESPSLRRTSRRRRSPTARRRRVPRR